MTATTTTVRPPRCCQGAAGQAGGRGGRGLTTGEASTPARPLSRGEPCAPAALPPAVSAFPACPSSSLSSHLCSSLTAHRSAGTRRLAIRRAPGAPMRLLLFLIAGAAMGVIDVRPLCLAQPFSARARSITPRRLPMPAPSLSLPLRAGIPLRRSPGARRLDAHRRACAHRHVPLGGAAAAPALPRRPLRFRHRPPPSTAAHPLSPSRAPAAPKAVVFWYAGSLQGALGIDGCIHVVLSCYTLRVLYYACARRRRRPSSGPKHAAAAMVACLLHSPTPHAPTRRLRPPGAPYSGIHWLGRPWLVLPVQLLHGITFGRAAPPPTTHKPCVSTLTDSFATRANSPQLAAAHLPPPHPPGGASHRSLLVDREHLRPQPRPAGAAVDAAGGVQRRQLAGRVPGEPRGRVRVPGGRERRAVGAWLGERGDTCVNGGAARGPPAQTTAEEAA